VARKKNKPAPTPFGALLRKATAGIEDRLDSWYNVITGLGTRADTRTRACVQPVIPLHDAELTDAYHGSWVANRMVRALVDDSLREGWSYETEELDKEAERWGANRKIWELAIWARTYGKAFLLLGTSDPDTSTPLTMSAGKLRYLRVFDRRHLVVNTRYTDPANPKFGEPETYWLYPIAADGQTYTGAPSITVHETRLISLEGTFTGPDLRARNRGWPLSVLQLPWEVMRDEDQTWASVGLLLRDMSTAVYKIKDFIQQLTGDGPDPLQNRMTLIEQARSTARAVVVDKDGEDFNHVGAQNVAGISDVLRSFAQRLSAAAEMPLSRLLQQQPGGLNATGESETRGWYDQCSSYQTHWLTKPVRQLGAALALNAGISVVEGTSEDAPAPDAPESYTRADADELADEVEVEWAPLWQETELECATREKAENEAWKVRVDMNELSGPDVARHRILEVPLEDIVKEAVKKAEEAAKNPPPALPGAPPPPGQAPPVPPENVPQSAGGSPTP
jgi:phage-related protein (TIGR01555 family)